MSRSKESPPLHIKLELQHSDHLVKVSQQLLGFQSYYESHEIIDIVTSLQTDHRQRNQSTK
jgi:hypothetical protein